MSQATLGNKPYKNSDLFLGHYLDKNVTDLDEWECDNEAEEAFDKIQTIWQREGTLLPSYKEDDVLDKWIDEILKILGFNTLSETNITDGLGEIDRTLFTSGPDRLAGANLRQDGHQAAMYNMSVALLEAKKWDSDFSKQFHEARQYRDASHQIKFYLERTPEDCNWGILTNGKKWRLYGTKDYETQTYYEVDLPELLESGDIEKFKYFYVFFRSNSFERIAGTTFLDKVRNECETAAKEIGEDLQNNVFTALRILGEGFIEKNDLDIGPNDEEALDELKEQSLVLLYRLMFVLYAESRGLINPDDMTSRDVYESNFSLEHLRDQILDDIDESRQFEKEYSTLSTSMWNRIGDLFELIDEGEESLGITAYNGGLFDRESHDFLTENEVSDRHLAEVIYRISTTKADDESYIPADYAGLDTRHLGSIYEGLLEHQFRIAPEHGMAAVNKNGRQVWKPTKEVSDTETVEIVEEDELYVVNDEDERKATGAYYTPDYVVTSIVEETVDPLIEDIKNDLKNQPVIPGSEQYVYAFADRVLELKIIDPAMGSGHFLTKVTGYIADQVMEEVRKVEKTAGVFNEQDVRRRVSKECIYGADLNGMAVELAKLSMWLETLSANQPLAFLDHHLKQGNSLVGSDITEVLSEEKGTEGDEVEGKEEAEIVDEELGIIQTSFTSFQQVRQDTLEHVMDLMENLLSYDNETLEDVKSMEEIYEKIREDVLYNRLFKLANVHTAEQFGVNIPDNAYERIANAIEDESQWNNINDQDWFKNSQVVAERENFFHWSLEYPEVYFGKKGVKKENSGFDAVIGNPPWGAKYNKEQKSYMKSRYRNVIQRMTDSSMFFIQIMFEQLKTGGILAYILPSAILTQSDYTDLREFILSNSELRQVINLGDGVFGKKVDNPSCILATNHSETPKSDNDVLIYDVKDVPPDEKNIILQNDPDNKIIQDTYLNTHNSSFITQGVENEALVSKLCSKFEPLETYITKVRRGISADLNEASIIDTKKVKKNNLENEVCKPILTGEHVRRFSVSETNKSVIYLDRDDDINEYPNIRSHLENYKHNITCSEVRDGKHPWYALHRPRDPEIFERTKIVGLTTLDHIEVGLDTNHTYIMDSLYTFSMAEHIDADPRVFVVLLNSSVSNFVYRHFAQEGDRILPQVKAQNLHQIPFPDVSNLDSDDVQVEYEDIYQQFQSGDVNLSEVLNRITNELDFLCFLLEPMKRLHNQRGNINVKLPDYLGSYDSGPTLADLTPISPNGLSDSLLMETEESVDDFEKIRVTSAKTSRDGNTVTVFAIPYVKPKQSAKDKYDTNNRGFAVLEPIPAMSFQGLSNTERKLVEVFVPYAVANEEGGYIDNATQTISLLNRLESIELPDPDDVANDLKRYTEIKKQAQTLEQNIKKTDDLIDRIVYNIYGLTDKEVEIIEETIK